MLDPEPDHLAGAQAAAVAETEQGADLEVSGDGEQAPCLVRADHQWYLLRLADVIDLGGKIQSPQCHANKNRSPVMMRLRLQMLTPASARCNWNRRISSVVAVSGERLRNAANRLQLRMWPRCVPAESFRAFLSSIMRCRSGVTAPVLMKSSCLGRG